MGWLWRTVKKPAGKHQQQVTEAAGRFHGAHGACLESIYTRTHIHTRGAATVGSLHASILFQREALQASERRKVAGSTTHTRMAVGAQRQACLCAVRVPVREQRHLQDHIPNRACKGTCICMLLLATLCCSLPAPATKHQTNGTLREPPCYYTLPQHAPTHGPPPHPPAALTPGPCSLFARRPAPIC